MDTKLIHIVDSYRNYYIDQNYQKQGEYWSVYSNRKYCTRCFFKDNQLHGEYIDYSYSGDITKHTLYVHGKEFPLPIIHLTRLQKSLLSDQGIPFFPMKTVCILPKTLLVRI